MNTYIICDNQKIKDYLKEEFSKKNIDYHFSGERDYTEDIISLKPDVIIIAISKMFDTVRSIMKENFLNSTLEKHVTIVSIVDESNPETYSEAKRAGSPNIFTFPSTLNLVDKIYNAGNPTIDYTNSSILVVDDSLIILHIVEEILSEFGIKVYKAPNGLDAYKMITGKLSGKIDLVITDLNMPKMNGEELCRKIKSDSRFRHLPIIFLTSQSNKDTEITIFEAGASDFIAKPFSKELFVARILVHLESRIINKNLNEIVKLRTRKLLKEKERAETTGRTKSEFLANMSHEIRTPINGIVGFTTMVLETDLDDEQREYLNTVKSCSDTLISLVNDILDLTKIESEKIELEMIDFDLEEVVYNVCDMVKTKLNERTSLLVDIDQEMHSFVKGDPTRLRQIIMNQLSNAVKFTEKGNIIIKAAVVDEISDRIRIKFSVFDTGIGMNEKQIRNIFKPFIQADGSTTRKYGGTGLGLAISKKLVEIMGGKLEVISTPGKGTVFFFTIEFQKAVKTPRKRLYQIEGKKCLIIDNTVISSKIIENISKKLRLEPESVSSIEDALNKITPETEIIIADYNSEKDSWEEFFQKIKQMGLSPHSIAVISDILGDSRSHIKNKGFEGYILKPVKRESLINMIRKLFTDEFKGEMISEQEASLKEAFRYNILVAEDNKVNQILAIKMLEKMGHVVTIAENGKIAVENLKEHHEFDLVLMDMQMPVMDGITATHAIRDFNRDIPIVAMTANAFTSDKEACIQAGMNAFIAKPVNRDNLRTIINEQCDAANAQSITESYKVLVVEDEYIVRNTISRSIAKSFPAFSISTASDGMEASIMIGSIKPDIIITDILMPKMDGLSLLKFLKSKSKYTKTGVIILTSLSLDDPRLENLENYGVNYIETKPCKLATLRKHISSVLARKEKSLL